MSDDKIFNFESFIAANAGNSVTGFDYIRAVYKSQNLPSDFVFYFAKLFWPEFKVVDGKVYVSDLFQVERYQELLIDNRSYSEVQFWTNLLEITGLFDGLSYEQAKIIARQLADCWNAKLRLEFDSSHIPARTIFDEDTEEVFVTIGGMD